MTKKIKRRNFVTEKFGLLNFLKAIDGLSGVSLPQADNFSAENGQKTRLNQTENNGAAQNAETGSGLNFENGYPGGGDPFRPPYYGEMPTRGRPNREKAPPQGANGANFGNVNYLAKILERHEEISNRLKKK